MGIIDISYRYRFHCYHISVSLSLISDIAIGIIDIRYRYSSMSGISNIDMRYRDGIIDIQYSVLVSHHFFMNIASVSVSHQCFIIAHQSRFIIGSSSVSHQSLGISFISHAYIISTGVSSMSHDIPLVLVYHRYSIGISSVSVSRRYLISISAVSE